MPDFFGRMVDLMNTQAQTQDINAQTQERLANTALIRNQLQAEQRFNAALSKLNSAQQTQSDSSQGLPSSLSGLGINDMTKPIIDGYKAEQQSAVQSRQLAQVAIQAGDFARSRQFSQEAEASDNRARQWYAEGLKLATEQRKEMSSIAGSYAPDGSNLEDVVQAVKEINPKSLQGAQFDRNPRTTDIVAGPKTTAAFASLADRNMTRSEQLSAQREADKIKQQAETNERLRAAEARNERKTDAQIAGIRSAIQARDAPPDTSGVVSDGAMVASGMPLAQAVPGWGTAAVKARNAAKNEAIRQIIAETGMDELNAGKELAQRQIDYFAGRRSTTQLNTMLGATRQAVKQLDFNVDKVTQEMRKLPSTDLSPLINGIIRGEERWTGNPAYSSLYFYMHAAAMESARILQGGQASIAQLHQGAAEEAKKWADIGLTPKMWASVAKAMHDEGAGRIKTYTDAMDEQRVGGRARSPQEPDSGGKTVDWKELK